MSSTKGPLAKAVAKVSAMADVLDKSGIDLSCEDSIARVLIESSFCPRESAPVADWAASMARGQRARRERAAA